MWCHSRPKRTQNTIFQKYRIPHQILQSNKKYNLKTRCGTKIHQPPE